MSRNFSPVSFDGTREKGVGSHYLAPQRSYGHYSESYNFLSALVFLVFVGIIAGLFYAYFNDDR